MLHAVLVPEHLREELSLGIAFVAASVLLIASALALVVSRSPVPVARALALPFAGLLAAYATTRVVAVPGLGWEREPLDLFGLSTKFVEAVGLVLALCLGREPAEPVRPPLLISSGGRP